MKTIKRLLTALLAALLTFSLAACNEDGGGEVNIPTNQNGSDDFQKNMHQSTTSNLRYICETEDGIYFQNYDVFVYYIEKATKAVTILCGKPECAHNDKTCNARLSAKSLWFYDGKLYFSNGNKVTENGQSVDYGDRIYSVNSDGTDRQAVQSLELVPNGDNSMTSREPIMHRGVTYFPYKGALYALPLGGDIEDAIKIWGDEVEGERPQVYDPNALKYTLWADGDFIYFMLNLKQSDGTYRDTLFAYDTLAKTAAQVWETPEADDVGSWEAAGVSVSQWYVMGGYIYFYLSGNDFWRSNLTTGENERLAAVSEKTASGSAIFSDDYLCILNDTPNPIGFDNYIDGTGRAGGDTLYIYGLDGQFLKELSLNPLYDDFDTLKHIQLSFISGNDVYFVVDANTRPAGTGGATGQYRNLILCCVNIDTGEITQIYTWE